MNALLTKVITSERKGNFIVYCFYLVHILGKGPRIRKAYEGEPFAQPTWGQQAYGDWLPRGGSSSLGPHLQGGNRSPERSRFRRLALASGQDC